MSLLSVKPTPPLRRSCASQGWSASAEDSSAGEASGAKARANGFPGIVIRGPRLTPPVPRVSAFLYGWQPDPGPTLPFGRWRDGR